MAKGSARQVRAILTRAAELIDAGEYEYCCYAICDGGVSPKTWMRVYDHLCNLFSPYLGSGGAKFWNMPNTPKRQRLRVLALLFAAASYEEP